MLPSDIQRALSNPDLLDDVCSHVASGGSALDYAHCIGVPWGMISNWIRKDTARSTRFDAAKRDGEEYAVYKLIDSLRALSDSDIRDLYTVSGTLKPVTDWNPRVASTVQAIESVETFDEDGNLTGYVRKVKFWDKPKSIELLGKHLKMWVERHEHTHKLTLEQIVKGSYDVSDKTVHVQTNERSTVDSDHPLSLPTEPIDIK